MVKKVLSILAVLVFSFATAWAGDDFSTANGDFKSFHLRESRDMTLARYDALLKRGDIWNGDVNSDGNLHFATRVAEDIFSVDLGFAHKQLARIFLFQTEGYVSLKASKLEYYIDEKLIRSISEEYGKPKSVFEFPQLSEIGIQPYILAEWGEWKNRVVVGVAQDKKLHAVVMIDAMDLLDGN